MLLDLKQQQQNSPRSTKSLKLPSDQQVNYAVVTSTEVAYLSYIYSVIPVENYQRATGYMRSAMLAGYTFGASLGQVLVSVVGRAYHLLINTVCDF